MNDFNADEFIRSGDRFLKKRKALIEASRQEDAIKFVWVSWAFAVLAIGVATLWLLGALTVKSLVLCVLGAFVVKKFGDYRHNAWVDRKIREIEERFPK